MTDDFERRTDETEEFFLREEMRDTLSGQVFGEMLRVDPEFRASFARSASGSVSLPVRPEDMAAVLEAFRSVPDDAGAEALRAALAPYAAPAPEVTDDGSAWRNRTRYEVGLDFDRRAAEATLLALRCMLPLPEEARGWGYSILPHSVPMRRDEVVEYLMSLTKPVSCVALGIGGTLAVGAWETEPEREGTPGVFERSRALHLKAMRDNFGDGEVRALLVGEGEELVMTAQEVEEWHMEYRVSGLGSFTDSLDPLVRARGVDFLVRFERMRVAEPDPEYRWE